MNYFDSNRTNTVIIKIRGGHGDALVVAIPSISYGILKNGKIGN